MLKQVAHCRRGNMRKLLGSRNDDGLDIRSKLTVGIRNRPLCLEIDHVPDTTHNVPDAKLTALVDGQVVILNDTHTLKTCSRLPDDLDPLLVREESPLVYIDAYSHDHFVKHRQSPLQDIEMAGCKWIERSRKHCYSFHIWFIQKHKNRLFCSFTL